MANVKNRFDQASNEDNAFRVGGTMDIESGSTFKVEGITVNTSGLAEKLNNLDSVEEVANKSGSPMTAGQLVYISGYDATLDKPIVSLADADDATKKATLVLTEGIVDGATGSAEPVATVTGLDTSSYSAVGSLVYESTTAGGHTPTAPTDANDDRRVVGVVKVKDAAVGSIYFFPGKGGLEHAAVYLNNLTPGTVSANGAVVVDANKHQDVANVTTLSLGASGSAVKLEHTPNDIVASVENTVTLAEVNAGKIIKVAVAGKSYIPVGVILKVVGNFATGTSIDLVDETTGTIVVSYAQAQLTDGAWLDETDTGVTLGAGFLASLATGEGLKVVKVGSDFTGGTSVTIRVLYKIA